MRKRYVFSSGLVLLTILLALVVWQVSFNFGDYSPANAAQTFLFWAVSLIVFILTVTLGFMLFRDGVKLYLERQSNREGSRIKSKFVVGALALSLLPVAFLFIFSYVILNRNVEKWFSRPAEGIRIQLIDTGIALGDEVQGRAQALANWLAGLPEVRQGTADFAQLCADSRIAELRVENASGVGQTYCMSDAMTGDVFTARASLGDGTEKLVVRIKPRADLASKQSLIQRYVRDYDQLAASKRFLRNQLLLFLGAITLFILFVSTWIALILSRQIITPISALLQAAGQVRKGNLAHRVHVRAIDELATLVRAFNEMTEELEGNARELENRRQFTEAILESIPTGVISLAPDGTIRKVNSALRNLFPEDRVENALQLSDLFPAEELAEIRYLMKRAKRTGISTAQFDMEQAGQVRHLAVTVSALPASAQGFVVVLEDTSDLLRAQKAAAWHEVARRIAHELKNPLTPIALSAERIARQLDRGAFGPDAQRILRECSATIAREVESVKMLADEFSQFARFPAAQPVACDLNEVVENGLKVFDGRLEGIEVRTDFAQDLPAIHVDPDQFKRVVVNLVDNAAEAMRDSHVRRLLVATRSPSPDTVELLVADTGCGISADDKEKLFLPYFSTKGRGTGLGLAIVSHILSEHRAKIRVEDNRPAGARFYVEIGAAAEAMPAPVVLRGPSKEGVRA
jgi:two-component system, NtrC family, nitrogen regulation sensor histidine kinase NtrY